eukprot:CAMPEP_0202906744 /NCGR_PEP_ID=MMETSP1392-20130828/40173_1 /ASSEMBLY_ACC=CAM_ASM_000868 /TAXON_ID=225041 /ORGANISM="Chlamydomonas chlamydogama, Strain SAG 11-48b" /LENGTH=77 /DNA_ID=CAMNT_0049595381 /DNA_START=53 /DNA_END=286 /DNA_ORIENTATION=-
MTPILALNKQLRAFNSSNLALNKHNNMELIAIITSATLMESLHVHCNTCVPPSSRLHSMRGRSASSYVTLIEWDAQH